jgi:hypothetical protein
VTRLLVAGLVAGALCPLATAAKQSFSPIVVTRDSLALKCSPRNVAEVAFGFETALGSGNAKALDAVFARRRFSGFSLVGPTIRARSRLVPHLLRLHARGESIHILAVEVGNSHAAGAVGFAVFLLRIVSAPSGSNHAGDGFTEALLGKGEFDCVRRQIYVLNLGARGADSPCPEVPTANALRTIVACSDTGRRPLAQEVSRDFTVGTTPLRLPRRCRPAAVKTRVVGALRAFNLAGATAFGRSFTRTANMQPYTASDPPLNLRGRSAIVAFAARRAASGDGWTAARLLPPTGDAGLPAGAVYGLALRVNWHGDDTGVKLVIDCRSGLIARWVGPALAEPK